MFKVRQSSLNFSPIWASVVSKATPAAVRLATGLLKLLFEPPAISNAPVVGQEKP
jgi:hypothetical protein